MWGTDGTAPLTGERQATIFIAVGHCIQEGIGTHSGLQGTRLEAQEPIRQGSGSTTAATPPRWPLGWCYATTTPASTPRATSSRS